MPLTLTEPATTLQKGVARIMTFSDSRSHSEPLLDSLRLIKFSDIIHLEIVSFAYQWYHKLSPSCLVNCFNPVFLIHSYDTRQSQIINNLFVKSVHTTQYAEFVLSVTLVQNFGILYLLMLGKSSRFQVFVNISRVL